MGAGERRHLARLEDHAVAGRQGGDAVAEGVGQRVVPGADYADQAEWAVAQDQLLALEQDLRRFDALVGEVFGRLLGPEAERVGGVGDLGELGVLVGLASLRDDRLDHALGVVDQPLLGAQQDARARLEAERVPVGLGGAATGGHLGDGGGGEVGDGCDDPARRRALDLDLSGGRRRSVVGMRGYILLDGRHVDLLFVRS
jgi:hypothetical protein